ncbi:NADAR family protein [Pseudomonas sp. RIT-To-2]|uniref:NADAR family protein n=1 Tax=Pseudomonas sp. RIT-To-2 TaxID=3462541 RepID=UPI00241357FF
MQGIVDMSGLLARVQAGERLKYLTFWGHTPRVAGEADRSCLSQWFPAAFELDGIHYATAEHYMMAEKARLFGDSAIVDRILKASTPALAKKLGREVKGYDDARWLASRFDIVVAANLHKFDQNPALKMLLLNTGDRVLVEASPVDAIWGIGLAADDPAAEDPARWQGLNLLGFALMQVRNRLA